MTKQGGKAAVTSYDRQCRNCASWTNLPLNVPQRCRHCDAEFPKRFEMGVDVPRFRGQRQKLPQLPGQVAAAKVPKPKPGEFGAPLTVDPATDISTTAAVERFDIPARGRPKNVTPGGGA